MHIRTSVPDRFGLHYYGRSHEKNKLHTTWLILTACKNEKWAFTEWGGRGGRLDTGRAVSSGYGGVGWWNPFFFFSAFRKLKGIGRASKNKASMVGGQQCLGRAHKALLCFLGVRVCGQVVQPIMFGNLQKRIPNRDVFPPLSCMIGHVFRPV
ncbi:hypothetical protein D8B26_005978 [Coccidioides posadasii str. Silveira]|uniref:uncharacterized protein n=1 Tax=Coccidioides posadasii (strain RMSCC 757 / Silveira) TaxID=443226 RepID=UPI001BF01C16|nr:hypothetical protein D8B26_005978 [Coccidioides posadasii str. Silveira]